LKGCAFLHNEPGVGGVKDALVSGEGADEKGRGKKSEKNVSTTALHLRKIGLSEERAKDPTTLKQRCAKP
jgi:hypothetical protein